MKVRLYSDLHREFDGWEIPKLKDRKKEKNYVVVLAGDIGVARKHGTYDEFLRDLCDRHKAVVYVPGNHEYYGDSFDRAWDKIKEMTGDIENLHFLNMDTVVIDDVMFIGATLWTDMDSESPGTMLTAKNYMNDYHVISRLSESDGDDGWAFRGKLQPHHTVSAHYQHRDYIDSALYAATQGEGLKTFVVTHHGPTWQSVDPQFIGSPLNGAYVSDLTDLIRERGPDVWVHGHTHHTVRYTESQTRVFSNPKGYPERGWRKTSESAYENPNFREDGLIPELNELLEV
jgi:predicted phosphodiesterase